MTGVGLCSAEKAGAWDDSLGTSHRAADIHSRGNSPAQRSEYPMRSPAKNVNAYLAEFPTDQRKAMERLRKLIKAAAPKAEETISYSMPMFKQNGQLVAFAAFKDHISFFVCSGSFLNRFPVDKQKFDTFRSGIHFTPEKPLPATLVTKIVKARLAENDAKAAPTRAKKKASGKK